MLIRHIVSSLFQLVSFSPEPDMIYAIFAIFSYFLHWAFGFSIFSPPLRFSLAWPVSFSHCHQLPGYFAKLMELRRFLQLICAAAGSMFLLSLSPALSRSASGYAARSAHASLRLRDTHEVGRSEIIAFALLYASLSLSCQLFSSGSFSPRRPHSRRPPKVKRAKMAAAAVFAAWVAELFFQILIFSLLLFSVFMSFHFFFRSLSSLSQLI